MNIQPGPEKQYYCKKSVTYLAAKAEYHFFYSYKICGEVEPIPPILPYLAVKKR